MTMLNAQGSWNVGRSSATCAACGTALAANTACWAALCDRPAEQLAPAEKAASLEATQAGKKKNAKEDEKAAPSPFIRIDFCEACWAQGKRPTEATMFSFWKTIVPEPQQKKKLLVDDSVLMDVFGRMEGRGEPQEIRFRFVLALILMRKRLLKYEGMDSAPAVAPGEATPGATLPPETWRMLPRGAEKPVLVINPHLNADQITEVSQQLSAILAEEI
jgi:hypothetical protein